MPLWLVCCAVTPEPACACASQVRARLHARVQQPVLLCGCVLLYPRPRSPLCRSPLPAWTLVCLAPLACSASRLVHGATGWVIDCGRRDCASGRVGQALLKLASPSGRHARLRSHLLPDGRAVPASQRQCCTARCSTHVALLSPCVRPPPQPTPNPPAPCLLGRGSEPPRRVEAHPGAKAEPHCDPYHAQHGGGCVVACP